jgi:hypothetical protein
MKVEHFVDIPTRVKQTIFRLARYVPAIQRQIAQAREDTINSVCANMAKSVKGHQFAKALPEKGLSKVGLLMNKYNMSSCLSIF